MKDCRYCHGPCEREVHAATVRVRKWFRKQLELSLREPMIGKLKTGVGSAVIK